MPTILRHPVVLDTFPRYSFKRRALKYVQPVIYWSGMASLFARLRQAPTATILMYHSVSCPDRAQWIDPCNTISAAVFERHVRFLARWRNVISLDQLVMALQHQTQLPRGTVVITFDDGYLDNLEIAAPILAKYGLPAVVYLATEYVTKGENQWIDTLYGYFCDRAQQRLTLSEFGLSDWCLRDKGTVRSAYFAIANTLLAAAPPQRQALLAQVKSQLQPVRTPPRLTMTWEDVRRLQREFPNITLGVHTVNHLDLSTHPEQTFWEIQTSIDQVKQHTGYCPGHFAYPYNRHTGITRKQLDSLPLASAVTTSADPVVRASADVYALPRVEVSQSMTLLRLRTGGAFPDLSRRLFGKAWTMPY